MPQDAFNLRRNAQELNIFLNGGKINRIIQPDKDEVSFNIYTVKGISKLIFNTNASFARICLSKKEKDSPLVAPNFCMLLRKHLLGGEIKKVEQIAFERIIAFTIHCTSDFSSCDRILYAEIMGKYSNLVLTESGNILGALKTTSLETNSHRILFPGAKYTLPLPQDKADPTDLASLQKRMSLYNEEDKVKFLCNQVAGIAPITAQQIINTFEGGDFSMHIQDYLFKGETCPCVCYENGIPTDFFAKNLPNSKSFSSLSEAQDLYYTYREEEKQFNEKKKKLLSYVNNLKKKQDKRMNQILDRERECDNMEDNKLQGELLTANLYALEKGMTTCRVVNYYDENCKEIEIKLDSRLTPVQNAQAYYKKYNKQKRTLIALAPQRKNEEEELDYTQSLLSSLENATELSDLKEIEEELTLVGLIKTQNNKKKKETPIPFRVFEIENFTVYAGRNNLQNDRLLKVSSPEDLWLHTQKYHSSHVIIQTNGLSVPDSVLLRAAQICAFYSDAKGGNKIPVDYCKRKFVKKPSRAKAGFVIYTDYQTILVEPSL